MVGLVSGTVTPLHYNGTLYETVHFYIALIQSKKANMETFKTEKQYIYLIESNKARGKTESKHTNTEALDLTL